MNLTKRLGFLKFSYQLCIYDSWLIFFGCMAVYWLSHQNQVTTFDSIPNSLLVFNWLINHTLDFDNFRNGAYYTSEFGVLLPQAPYFFIESQSGHLTSLYPIGTAIISFPIYVCFALLLLIQHAGSSTIDITSATFEPQRIVFEQIASSIIAALSVVVFYRICRLKANRGIALISALLYAFATSTWVISSQALWQHGSSNLVLLGCILCLWNANRSQGIQKILLILNTGILCGFLLSIRPTNAIFVLAIVLYSLISYRRQTFFFLLGFSSIAFSLAWNFHYFGSLVGGYQALNQAFYDFTFQSFGTGFLGLPFNPNRGLFIYTPILVFSIPGAVQLYRRPQQKDEKLMILLLFSCVALFLQYCFSIYWSGGTSYSARLLTDTLPVLCFLLNSTIAQYFRHSSSFLNWKVAAFVVLSAFSIFAQVVGVFSQLLWENIPLASYYSLNLKHNRGFSMGFNARMWQVRDSQLERNTRNIAFRMTRPTLLPSYASGLAGKILQVRDSNTQVLPPRISVLSGEKVQLSAIVQNIGVSPWFGYRSGADRLGEARVRVKVTNAQFTPELNQKLPESRLFISGNPSSGETAMAIGEIFLPRIPGTYQVRFSLITEGLSEMQLHSPMAGVTIEVLPIDVGY